jgi:hypothetical protein
MGVETDFFYAEETELNKALNSNSPAEDFDGVYAKGSDPFSLACLKAAVKGEEVDYDAIDEIVNAYSLVETDDEGNLMVLNVPNSLKETLDSINEQNLDEIINNWTLTEGFEMSGWDSQIAKEFISDMKTMIQKYKNTNKNLYMWVCV